MNLLEATSRLDPANDDHWTADGLPRMTAVGELAGDSSITRKDITHAAPNLTRALAQAQLVEAENTGVVRSENLGPKAADPPAPEKTFAELVLEEDGAPKVDVEATQVKVEVELDTQNVLDLPVGTVLGHPDLTKKALDEINRKVAQVLSAKAKIDEELKQLYAKTELLSRQEVLHDRIARQNGTKRTNVQDYLAAQSRAREERAARARKFIDAGTTPADVAAQLRGGSRLDAAMKQRKPALGSRRPPVRIPSAMS